MKSRIRSLGTRTVRLLLLLVILAPIALVVGADDLRRGTPPAPPAATPPLPSEPAPVPPAAWLGLNYNSGSSTGSRYDFALRGIVYDREGRLEVRAGATPRNNPDLDAGLASSYAASMVPDLQ